MAFGQDCRETKKAISFLDGFFIICDSKVYFLTTIFLTNCFPSAVKLAR